MSEPSRPAPALRIVSGSPTPEELAAVTAVVAASAGGGGGGGRGGEDAGGGDGAPEPAVRRGGWNDPARLQRPTLTPGPNGWRAAAP